MATFVAFLRGISPSNPNMRNEKLCAAFESLEFENVRAVISSGNIIFEAPDTPVEELEEAIEARLHAQLGITGCAIVHSADELRQFVSRKPFGNRKHSPQTYLMATFIQDRRKALVVDIPPALIERGVEITVFNADIYAVCAYTDTTQFKTPDFMKWMEANYGKDITTRTWKTIERVASKL